MTLRSRQSLLWIGVGVLVVLNVWRWWPGAQHAEHSQRGNALSGQFQLSDFEVKALTASAQTTVKRDIFRPKVSVVARPKKPPGPPPKSPEELAREAAQAELGRIRCVGISVQGTRIQAFLTNAGQNYLVSPGDRAGGRFVVDKITAETVYLHDPETGVAGEIGVAAR